MDLNENIKQLPTSPGVYIMYDASGVVMYVGKARNLRQRVKSYFRASGDGRFHIRFLMAKVADLNVIVTDTEKEALLLENTLIKQHHPRYNLDLKDDKQYFSLRIDPEEEFPRFTVVRKVPGDRARYFGPYVSAAAARQVLQQLSRMFPLRHYPLASCMSRSRPCLYFQIGQCSAPCHGNVTAEEYAALVTGGILFLEGKSRELISEFRRRMNEAAADLRYEEAARWRNLLNSIDITLEKQKVVARGGDCDVLGYCRSDDRLELVVLFVRGGVLSGSRQFGLKWELDDANALESFLGQFYQQGNIIPDEILLPVEVESSASIAELLGDLRGRKVQISCPKRGSKRELVELACKNASAAISQRIATEARGTELLEELRSRLHLSRLPRRIECYDISTIQGRYSVGSGITFRDGVADTSRYRRYRIRGVEGQDDFAMLAEVFGRRFRPETVAKDGLPDLVVVDGGIGQLNAAREIIAGLGLTESFDLVSLAKSRTSRDAEAADIEKSSERVFLPGRRNPVVLKQNSKPLLLLAAIRDEAHRFAIEYHRRVRSKEVTASALDELPGIGAKRRGALLKHFGSLQRVKEAAVEDLAQAPGMSRAMALKVFQALHNNVE